MKHLEFGVECSDPFEPRIGGAALIGGILDWPATSSGKPLHLIMSCPARFLGVGEHDEFVSVFSFYSPDDYFLDQVTYHGDPQEMQGIVRNGTARVIFHRKGEEIQGAEAIPSRKLRVQNDVMPPFQGSGIGGPPGFLQNEKLALAEGMRFSLQLYSGDFPEGWTDVFGLRDAVAYLFLDGQKREGLFFVQVT